MINKPLAVSLQNEKTLIYLLQAYDKSCKFKKRKNITQSQNKSQIQSNFNNEIRETMLY